MTSDMRIGVVGGSGLYAMSGLDVVEERILDTPFGAPSGPFVIGELDGERVVFLARHDTGHRLLPSEINYRANVFAFKTLGVEWLISVSAVGSMKEAYEPLHVVVPDQFIDRTRHRPDTFFGDGIAAHVSLADPISAQLADVLAAAATEVGATTHVGGTYLCMEGPQFSTRAESNLYRSWGVDVIGMTNLTEARLAREAEISYATLAMVTDYDCWHESEEDVSVTQLLQILRKNASTGQDIVRAAIRRLSGLERTCPARDALATAIVTQPEHMSVEVRERLAPIIGRYVGDAN
ncbi:MAG: S-methyl-5'-thioadenosine phosphorylase [Acidobacteriota bacterium]